MIWITFLILILFESNWSAYCLNSYIYLPDKFLKEEMSVGSFVINLSKELEKNDAYKKQVSKKPTSFTLLDDSKLANGNAYFQLDSNSGILTTKQLIDRENMCINRQCAELCELGAAVSHNSNLVGSCRINLNIIVMPSYNILNLNVFIEDINDNQPYFPEVNITQYINENVPIGYKIPINLAYDPDIGHNTIQRYQITNDDDQPFKTDFGLIMKTFKLSQNLNESQLHLVVNSKLDREETSSYNLTITAFDGGVPILSSKLNLNIIIVDINDNNPIFEKDFYKFTISESAKVDTTIGQIKAVDLDQGHNGLVKYNFVDNSNRVVHLSNQFVLQKGSAQTKQENIFKYFDLNELSGVIKLKNPLDYEDENHFSLLVEARDSGVGSLPSYTTVEIDVTDTNDNAPEISISFLNTLRKTVSSVNNEFKYDIYIPEHTKTNKFIAHVSITDKDSNENGRFDWMILVNEKVSASSNPWIKKEIEETDSILKLINLNNNSFTLNIGNSNLLDYESSQSFNITIRAWDYGTPNLPQTTYKFAIKLIDINDNAPRFEQSSYDISVHENNEPSDIIYKLSAFDSDPTNENSNITYSIKEPIMNDYLSIDSNGNLISKIKFDREKIDQYVFHVIATDNGAQPLSASTLVSLNILDLNDNHPTILFNTSFYHRFYLNKKQQIKDENNFMLESTYSVLIRISEDLPIFSDLIDFRAYDRDLNANIKFSLENTLGKVFEMSPDGQLRLAKNLDKNKQSIYELIVLCQDFDGTTQSLTTALKVIVEVVHLNEYCLKTDLDDSIKSKFINRDMKNLNKEVLFMIDYSLTNINTPKSDVDLPSFGSNQGLNVELLTHKDLIQAKAIALEKINNELDSYRIMISFKEFNTSRLMLGKYTIKLRLIDRKNPSCTKTEQFTLLIGNNLITEKEIITFLQSLKQKKNESNQEINSNAKNEKIQNNPNDYNKFTNEILLNDDLSQNNNNPNQNDVTSNEHTKMNNRKVISTSPKMLKSDYILLFILIVIVVITTILFAFIAILCIYSKYKKQYDKNVTQHQQTSSKKSSITISNEDDDNNDEDSDNFLTKSMSKSNGNGKKSKKTKKLIFKTTSADLNSSSSSNTSSDLLGGKPQYTLVNNGSNSSNSAASNTTLMYRDAEDDDFAIVASPTNTFKKKLPQYHHNQYHIHHQQQQLQLQQQLPMQIQHPRFIYSSGLGTKLNGYEVGSNRSNSAAESFVDSTTIDDSKSSGSNQDYELTNISQIKTDCSSSSNRYDKQQKCQMSDPSSSAYGSISNSDNITSDSENRNKKSSIEVNNMVYVESNQTSTRNKFDPNLQSFRKGVLKHETSNTFNTLNHNTNLNQINNKNFNNNLNFNPKTVARTSFNL